MKFPWPDGFERLPREDWTRDQVEHLALKYDSVENHGWYSNLARSVEQIGAFLQDGDVLLDYSGGTGILAGRLVDAFSETPFGVVIVDSSPKFLRLALEKYRSEERIALRLIRYLKPLKRLEFVDEVLGPGLVERGVDAIACSNAIHLYYDLAETLRSWRRVLKSGGRAFVQSGNIRNPDCGPGEWIIDETVDHIHEMAVEIVRETDRFSRYRSFLDDKEHMALHDTLRQKYFLPVRPLSHYVSMLNSTGLQVKEVTRASILARVEEWFDFLAVYHEGVLGWVGGAEKLTGRPPAEDVIRDRFSLMRLAMDRIFAGQRTFIASWTYIICENAAQS